MKILCKTGRCRIKVRNFCVATSSSAPVSVPLNCLIFDMTAELCKLFHCSRNCLLVRSARWEPTSQFQTMASLTYLSMRSQRAHSTRTDIEGSSLPQSYRPDVLLEEETLPRYQEVDYDPVRINEVINMKYRVVSKLGFGVSSTVWLAQDTTRYVDQACKPQCVLTRIEGGSG